MHELRIATRWTDFDALDHLTHSVAFAYLDEARDALLAERVGGFDEWPSVVARVSADFRREVPRGPRELVVRSRVVEVGGASVRVAQELLGADGEVAIEAEAVVVAFDLETRASRRIGDDERRRLLAG
ncbi:MAG TPA: thioesterase family protein [Gaiellaceae bacterium]|nr:thioesterase family protein [Gaiellaceae bacterium]